MIAAPPSGHSRMPSSPEPAPAATILMLRDGPEGLEVFMVVRHHQIDFASGALVFPGGKVDPGDAVVRDHCDGADDLDERDLAMRVGAIREAFEECGILLARPRGDTTLVSGARLEALDAYRDKLHSGELSLADFLDQEQLTLALDTLTRFAHWITPEMMPKRFDTDFFVAAAPADHVALHDGHESVDSIWIRPDDALAGAVDGTYTVIFPTRLNIEMLAESKDVADAVAASVARRIVSVLPVTEKREDGNYIVIPADAGYRISEEKMAVPAGSGKGA